MTSDDASWSPSARPENSTESACRSTGSSRSDGTGQRLTKRCSGCEQTKAGEAFAKNRNRKDGLQSQCRACTRKYRRTNREKIRKKDQAYCTANREKIRKRCRAYYAANREKCLASTSEYQRKNPEKKRAYGRKYREANPEKMLYDGIRDRQKRDHGVPLTFTFEEFDAWLHAELRRLDWQCPDYSYWLRDWGYARLELVVSEGHGNCPPSAVSIDRIDNDAGYEFDNMRVVSWAANHDRGKRTLEDWFERLADPEQTPSFIKRFQKQEDPLA